MNGAVRELRGAVLSAALLLASVALASAGLGGAAADTPSGSALVKAMQGGGYVLVMRHASSPQERPEPPAAEPDNPRAERQLDPAGKAAAAAMGAAIKQLRIPIGEVLTSTAYRAIETARLAGLGASSPNVLLADGGKSMQDTADDRRSTWLRDEAAKPPPAGANRVLVTHLPNIAGAFGDAASGIADGEALVFHPDGKGGTSLAGRIKIDDWLKLASGR
jgi:phosphohistidine phosphatase SixA